MKRIIFSLFLLFMVVVYTHAQEFNSIAEPIVNPTNPDAEEAIDSIEKDLSDVWSLFKSSPLKKRDRDSILMHKKLHLAVIPGIGYALQTGFSTFIAGNGVFKTAKGASTNPSSFYTLISITQYKQLLLPLVLSIWTPKNKFHITSDNRFLKYPSLTFGIGERALDAPPSALNFLYLKMHETIMRKIRPNVYVGLGYYFDRFWNIREVSNTRHRGTPAFIGLNLDEEALASGLVAKITYDSRPRLINPLKGLYASLLVRDNTPLLGGDSRWRSGLLEIRKFFTLPGRAKNVLAIWSHNWFTLNGNPHYLMLPSTGWDDNFNTGRGYIQSRFRGSDMFYLEGEFRYRILPSGILGGVVFGNLQYFTGNPMRSDQILVPAGGLGLRIKMNKKSATNLAIDYGFGINGSQGFFINLGESF